MGCGWLLMCDVDAKIPWKKWGRSAQGFGELVATTYSEDLVLRNIAEALNF